MVFETYTTEKLKVQNKLLIIFFIIYFYFGLCAEMCSFSLRGHLS